MTSKHIDFVRRERGYDGFFKIDVLHFRHTLYAGGWSEDIQREIFGRGEAVVVLLYDPAARQVVLVEQCRAGALDHARDNHEQAWLIEPVAGMIDQGETPLEACYRETWEEAGVKCREFEFVTRFYPSPGGSSEVLHLYAAAISVDDMPEFGGVAHEHEDIRLIRLSYEQARTKLLAGDFHVASTLIALQWLFFQK